MAAEMICDGCGKRVPMQRYENSPGWHKPFNWFQRQDKDGIQDACSRECIQKIAQKTGKSAAILPF